MVSAGKYKFGEMQKKHLVRILRTNIVVRVGGGWETMESFLNQHDPCRVTGKGNVESILANLPKPGEALGELMNCVELGYRSKLIIGVSFQLIRLMIYGV